MRGELRMKHYEVRYRLYARSRQSQTEKVQAANDVGAAAAIALKYWRYPFRIISVFEVAK